MTANQTNWNKSACLFFYTVLISLLLSCQRKWHLLNLLSFGPMANRLPQFNLRWRPDRPGWFGTASATQFWRQGCVFCCSVNSRRNRLDGWKKSSRCRTWDQNHSVNHPCTELFFFLVRKNALENLDVMQKRDWWNVINKTIVDINPRSLPTPADKKFVGRGEKLKVIFPLVANYFSLGRARLTLRQLILPLWLCTGNRQWRKKGIWSNFCHW